LVRELGAAPNWCTYPVDLSMFLQDLTPESFLEEIWYGSQGLHLIGATIYNFQKGKLGETRSELF
jgi:hypothetical protein